VAVREHLRAGLLGLWPRLGRPRLVLTTARREEEESGSERASRLSLFVIYALALTGRSGTFPCVNTPELSRGLLVFLRPPIHARCTGSIFPYVTTPELSRTLLALWKIANRYADCELKNSAVRFPPPLRQLKCARSRRKHVLSLANYPARLESVPRAKLAASWTT
jgi:hypothetical protein